MKIVQKIIFLVGSLFLISILFQNLRLSHDSEQSVEYVADLCDEDFLKDAPFDTAALINKMVAEVHLESKEGFIDSLSRMKRLWGIDISKYQDRINWDLLVRKNRPDFVFVKATEGVTIRDRMYRSHKRNLEKHDILHGAYHFWSFRTNGTAQARKFIRHANLKKGNLAPVVDVEYGRSRLPSKRKIVRELKRFCRVIEKQYGVKPIIYTQPHLYAKYLKDDFSSYPIWFADYRKQPKGEWAIWQHTATARLYGIHGKVDKNIMRTDRDILKQVVML